MNILTGMAFLSATAIGCLSSPGDSTTSLSEEEKAAIAKYEQQEAAYLLLQDQDEDVEPPDDESAIDSPELNYVEFGKRYAITNGVTIDIALPSVNDTLATILSPGGIIRNAGQNHAGKVYHIL